MYFKIGKPTQGFYIVLAYISIDFKTIHSIFFFDLTLAHKTQLNTNNTDKTPSENTLVNLFTLILQMIAENEFRVQENITAAVVRCSGEDNC